MKPILIILPDAGYDPSEAAISWQQLQAAGEHIVFATPDGNPAVADPLMVSGEGLDLWSRLPGLHRMKLVGLFLRANRDARRAHAAMIQSRAYGQPLRYADVDPGDYDGIVFPGGHAKPIRRYLESEALFALVNRCLDGQAADRHLPIGAICHGVLVLARARNAQGESAIARRRVTALTWALEKKAWQTARLTRFWEPDYYRTYAEQPGEAAGYWSVEQEISRALIAPGVFLDVQHGVSDYRRKTDGLHRDTRDNSRPSWVVRDGHLVTARWPGDAHAFAAGFLDVVREWRTQEGHHEQA